MITREGPACPRCGVPLRDRPVEEVPVPESLPRITQVIKRDGRVQDFDPERIKRCIGMAFEAQGIENAQLVERLALQTLHRLGEKGFGEQRPPSVEDCQDAIEETLAAFGYIS
ncbi:MAG: ATP cone domain-containing protein, partial [Candidatus Hadarchaeales archaeon]